MSHEPRVNEIQDPGPIQDVGNLKTAASTAIFVGFTAFAMQYMLEPKMAWSSYLQGFFYALCLGLGGAFFITVNTVTKSVWCVPLRRVAEAMTSILSWTLVLVIPILIASGSIYEWTDHHASHLYGTKAAYLSTPFWILRVFMMLVLWAVLTSGFRNRSTDQDGHKQELNQVGKSIIYLIVFAFGFTLFSIDVLMSLRPHWFSTMWGVYCFAGSFQAALCVMVLVTIHLRENGQFKGIVKDRHLFDLGTWLLAWCTFMAYIGFSQFMLIWYANLPEETPFFLDHLWGEWGILYVLVFFVKWAIPFFVLMPKPSRVNHTVLKVMATAILLVEWVDIHWMVQPEIIRMLNPNSVDTAIKGSAFNGHFILSFLVGMGFLGLFILSMLRFMGRHSVVPVGDPKLLSSVNGDYL